MYDQSENESSHSIDLLGLKVFQSRLHQGNVFTPGVGQRRPRVEPLALVNPKQQRGDRALDGWKVTCPHDGGTFRAVVAAHYRSSSVLAASDGSTTTLPLISAFGDPEPPAHTDGTPFRAIVWWAAAMHCA